MSRHIFSKDELSRGGRATASLPGGECPKCGRYYLYRLQLVGHLGLHGLAEARGISLVEAGRLLGIMGAAATDPAPWNRAFANGHQALEDYRKS